MKTLSKKQTAILIRIISHLHAIKGWNSVHAFVKRNKLNTSLEVENFGLDGVKTNKEKGEWLKGGGYNEFRAHLYSEGITSHGWSYNRIRGQQLTILPTQSLLVKSKKFNGGNERFIIKSTTRKEFYNIPASSLRTDLRIILKSIYRNLELKKGEKIFIQNDNLVYSYKGELYHFYSDEYRNILTIGRKAIKTRRENKLFEIINRRILNKKLNKIFVGIDDSIAAGNCISETVSFKEKAAKAQNAEGDFYLRADILISMRNDAYTRRAISKAYLNGHFIHN